MKTEKHIYSQIKPCTITQKNVAALNLALSYTLDQINVDLREFPYVKCSTVVLVTKSPFTSPNSNVTTFQDTKFRLSSYKGSLLCYGYVRNNISCKINPTLICNIIEAFLFQDAAFTIALHDDDDSPKFYQPSHFMKQMLVFDIFNRIEMIKSMYKQQQAHNINTNDANSNIYPLLSIILDKSKCKFNVFKKGAHETVSETVSEIMIF